MTGGRLEFGIARGAQYEFDRLKDGMPQQEGVAYMKEILPAVRALWQGDYAHDGHPEFPVATSVPKRSNPTRRFGRPCATPAASIGRSSRAATS